MELLRLPIFWIFLGVNVLFTIAIQVLDKKTKKGNRNKLEDAKTEPEDKIIQNTPSSNSERLQEAKTNKKIEAINNSHADDYEDKLLQAWGDAEIGVISKFNEKVAQDDREGAKGYLDLLSELKKTRDGK